MKRGPLTRAGPCAPRIGSHERVPWSSHPCLHGLPEHGLDRSPSWSARPRCRTGRPARRTSPHAGLLSGGHGEFASIAKSPPGAARLLTEWPFRAMINNERPGPDVRGHGDTSRVRHARCSARRGRRGEERRLPISQVAGSGYSMRHCRWGARHGQVVGDYRSLCCRCALGVGSCRSGTTRRSRRDVRRHVVRLVPERP